MAGDKPRRARGWRRWGVGGTLIVAVLAGVLAVEAAAWRDGLAGERRVMPGTVVAGIDVSLGTGGEIREAAAAAADGALDRRVTLLHGNRRWQVTARELGGSTDLDAVVARALAETASASPLRAAAVRWLGHGLGFARQLAVEVPGEQVAALTGELARAIDRDPTDARAAWRDGKVVVLAARPGLRLDRERAAAAVTAALEGGADRVDLPVARVEPRVPTAALEARLPDVQAAAEAALAAGLTVRHGDRAWEVSPRELGAVPHLEPAGGTVPLRVPLPALDALVATLASEVDRDPRDAAVDHSSGWVELVPGEPGVTVDRRAARERLRAAFASGDGSVELPVVAVQPGRTVEDYHHVLLVRQDRRRLYLYVDGEIAREWPVAVGAGGSATPTGVFEVGRKRHRPTWYNPSPEGWGADMPRVVGPGPTNPLGLRALNWDRDGRDTLIRFHGTSDLGSIGRAASRGCVRMTNGDVVELFDLVEPGTTIVSTWG